MASSAVMLTLTALRKSYGTLVAVDDLSLTLSAAKSSGAWS
jgi:ABC-type branched-subunit amino acid transport system ATPase component